MTLSGGKKYILVKDKDGKLKYYLDGKFFSVEEVEAERKQKPAENQVSAKKAMKPVLTYKSTLTSAPPSLKVKEIIEKEVSAGAKEPAKKLEMGWEDLQDDSLLSARREDDQKVIDSHVGRVIEKLKIQFSEAKTENRFRDLLKTFFRGVRTIKEVGYILGLPKVSGGMELAKDKTSLILSVIELESEELNRGRKEASSRPPALTKIIPAEKLLPAPPPAVVVEHKTERPKSSQAQFEPLKREILRPAGVQAVSAAKPSMENIISGRRLIGPLEELEFMGLKDFRALGRTAKEIGEELFEKFQMLAAQSLVQKMKGIAAWRKSPVMRLYLMMTMDGIKGKKGIVEVIESRQIKNQETLTLSEYEIVGEVNRKLWE